MNRPVACFIPSPKPVDSIFNSWHVKIQSLGEISTGLEKVGLFLWFPFLCSTSVVSFGHTFHFPCFHRGGGALRMIDKQNNFEFIFNSIVLAANQRADIFKPFSCVDHVSLFRSWHVIVIVLNDSGWLAVMEILCKLFSGDWFDFILFSKSFVPAFQFFEFRFCLAATIPVYVLALFSNIIVWVGDRILIILMLTFIHVLGEIFWFICTATNDTFKERKPCVFATSLDRQKYSRSHWIHSPPFYHNS